MIQPELTSSHFNISVLTRNTSQHLKDFLLKTNPLPGGVDDETSFLVSCIKSRVVWQRAELRSLPPVSQWKITAHPTANLVGPHQWTPSLCWPKITGFFISPAITSLLLPPYFSHTFVSKDAQVSLTFPNPYCCGRIKWVCFTLISSECILILSFYFIGSLGFFFFFFLKFLSPNKHLVKDANFLGNYQTAFIPFLIHRPPN